MVRVVDGTVINHPSTSGEGISLDLLLKSLLKLLLLLVVLTSPALMRVAAVWLLVILVLGWFLARVLGRFGIVGLLLLASSRRRSASVPDAIPVLHVSADTGGRTRFIQLRGHDDGIDTGDRIVARGVQFRNTLHAWSVRNLSTSVTLGRAGRIRLVIVALLDSLLLVTVLSQVLSG